MKKLIIAAITILFVTTANAQTTKKLNKISDYTIVFVDLKEVKIYNRDRYIGQCKVDKIVDLVAADSVRDYIYTPVVFNTKSSLDKKGTINLIDGNK